MLVMASPCPCTQSLAVAPSPRHGCTVALWAALHSCVSAETHTMLLGYTAQQGGGQQDGDCPVLQGEPISLGTSTGLLQGTNIS